MDCLSHALVGITLYQTRKSRFISPAPGLFWAALAGSELPDVDIVYRLDGDMAYLLNHRGITHSLSGVLLLTAALAYLLHCRHPGTAFASLFRWCGGAALVHILLDALNTWGTRIWFPFSNAWITWDVLPFIDPPLFVLCGISLLAGLLKSQNSRYYALTALSIFTLYVGGRFGLHQYILHELQLQYCSTSLQKISVLPTIHPLRWQAVIETKTSVVFGSVNPVTMRVHYTAWYPTCEDPLLTKYRSNTAIARFLPFFRYPALSLKQEAGKNVIIISDLYFHAHKYRRAAFELHSDGSIERPRLIQLPINRY